MKVRQPPLVVIFNDGEDDLHSHSSFTLDLPDLALYEAFLSMTAGQLCTAMAVCKLWYEMACWDAMWTNVCNRVGVRGASREVYRQRMEAMVADKRQRGSQGQECCLYDDLVLDNGRRVNVSRHQYASMSAKYGGPDVNSFRTRGGFSATTDRFVQIEFHLIYFRDEQFVGFLTEDKKDTGPHRSGAVYANGRDGYRISLFGTRSEQLRDATLQAMHEKVPRYYNGARISIRLDFERGSCTWWLDGEHIFTLPSLPEGKLYLCAGPDYEGDVTHMKPFTSSTTDWLNGSEEEAVPLIPRRGRIEMSQYTDWRGEPLKLHPTASELLTSEPQATRWVKMMLEEQRLESRRGGLEVSMLWLIPSTKDRTSETLFKMLCKVAAGNLRTVGVAGGTFSHTTSLAVFLAACEYVNLDVNSADPPCALVLKPHDEKILLVRGEQFLHRSASSLGLEWQPVLRMPTCGREIRNSQLRQALQAQRGDLMGQAHHVYEVSHNQLKNWGVDGLTADSFLTGGGGVWFQPVDELETRLQKIVKYHREPRPSFALTESTATAWMDEVVSGNNNIGLVAFFDEDDAARLEAYASIQDRSHDYSGPRGRIRLSLKLAHAVKTQCLANALDVIRADAQAAGVMCEARAAPCIYLIKPFDEKVALLPHEELVDLQPQEFKERIVQFFAEQRDPTPSQPLSRSHEMEQWVDDKRRDVALLAYLEPGDSSTLNVYMQSARRCQGIPFAHTSYSTSYELGMASANVPVESSPIAPCILLLKPFDEKYALLSSSELVDLDEDAFAACIASFIDANRLPKPSLLIATDQLLQMWVQERVNNSDVTVLALLDGESHVDSLMRVGRSDEMRRRVKLAHTSDAALLTAAAAIADVPLPEALPAPCFLLLKPFDEKYALLPASELAALDDAGFEARLRSFVEANWQPKPSCPVDDGALAASWAAERVAKRELGLVALFAADGPPSLVDVYMRFVGSEGVKGVVKAAHTTVGASFQAAAAELAAGVAAAPAVPCVFILKPFDETYALLPASELSALDDAGFEARLRSFFDANKQPKPSFHLATVEAATAWAADREAAGAVALVALLPANAPGTTDAYMSVALQPAVKGKVSFAHATDAAVFAAARDAGPFDAPCAHMANFQLASDVTAERLPASELAALDGDGLKVRRVPSSRMCPRVLSPTCTRAQARLLRLCADNLLPRGLRDVGVSTPTPPAMAPNAPVGPSDNTHNILTVTEGVLVARVEFGTGGDDDQFLGVLQEAAPDQADYGHLQRGWCVSSNRRAMAKGSPVGGERWHLKGYAVTMLVDVARASVSFWSDGAHATLSTGLPPNTPLTAALGLFHNTATVTALRHVPPGSADPLLAGVRGGAAGSAGSAGSAGGATSSAGGGAADGYMLDDDDY